MPPSSYRACGLERNLLEFWLAAYQLLYGSGGRVRFTTSRSLKKTWTQTALPTHLEHQKSWVWPSVSAQTRPALIKMLRQVAIDRSLPVLLDEIVRNY